MDYMDKSSFRVACFLWVIWTAKFMDYMDKSEIAEKTGFLWVIWTFLAALAAKNFVGNAGFYELYGLFLPILAVFCVGNHWFLWIIWKREEIKKNSEKNSKIMSYMDILKICSVSRVFYGLYGQWVIWTKKVDFRGLVDSDELYGRPYNS